MISHHKSWRDRRGGRVSLKKKEEETGAIPISAEQRTTSITAQQRTTSISAQQRTTSSSAQQRTPISALQVLFPSSDFQNSDAEIGLRKKSSKEKERSDEKSLDEECPPPLYHTNTITPLYSVKEP